MNVNWKVKRFDELSVKELHDLMKLRVDIFVVEQKCAYHEIDGKDVEAVHLLGHTNDGTLVAYARILPPENESVPHLGRIVVRDTERGHGLATALMALALETLNTLYGSMRSGLAAQSHLEEFYGRSGYVRQGPDYMWDGIPHVDMLRQQ